MISPRKVQDVIHIEETEDLELRFRDNHSETKAYSLDRTAEVKLLL